MFDFVQKSLRNKLLITFIAIGFLPFITLLTYTLFLSETKIVNKIVVEQSDRTSVVIKLIDNHLKSLTKEVAFLSSLDLMDDLLAEDIDKRISRLLTQKVNDLNLEMSLTAIDLDSSIVASSTLENLQKEYKIIDFRNSNNGNYIKNSNLYIYSKIYASFDDSKELGYLLLTYSLANLDEYLTHDSDIHSYIVNQKNGLTIGENLGLKLNFTKSRDSIINKEFVVVYKSMPNILNDWYIVYAVDKSVALAFLYDFISFMLYVSVVIFLLIIYISVRYSKGIVKPIEELTYITNDITNTHNYSAQVSIDTKDEIATLAHSFNEMLKTTFSALEDLEEENRVRLKRFTQLIEVFNTIIQTKSESECMDISIQEIKKLTNKEDLYFYKEKHDINDKEFIELYVTDFEHDEKLYFGCIELGLDNFADKNEKNFYNSIATMITHQLDRIRLIERTMSASNAKSAFISNMSHELRTPLNAIIGFSQFMITYEELTDDQQDSVANIESSAQYLLEMINEILDIAKIEAGKMEVHLDEVNIEMLIQSSYNMLYPLADDKGLDFNISVNKFDDKQYKTDPKIFQQILINLISNAIKFTKDGAIDVELSSDEQNIIVSVKDSGIGISEEDIKLLFNDFTQVENVMQKKHKGTGLGLSLSKKMAKMLGGDVSLFSDGEGSGTSAVFRLKKILVQQ